MIGHFHRQLSKEKARVEAWASKRFGPLTAPIYSSADIRYAGYKMSVVDTNIFPAGFNNLCRTFATQAAQAFQAIWPQYRLDRPKVLILPEGHTRNAFYWENVHALIQILKEAGASVWVGRYPEIGIDLPDTVQSNTGEDIAVVSVKRKDDRVTAGSVSPDLVLLNNDFSHGFPEQLCGLEQAVLPSPALGWHQRRKSDHFRFYEQLISELSELLGFDPWFLSPLMTTVENINIHEADSQARLKQAIDELIAAIQSKHDLYGISSKPYVFIKDNSGTYGMGVMPVASGQEVMELGRRKRNKLMAGKGRLLVTDYLIQEGLPTIQSHEENPLEPIVYLVGGEPVGQFFRIHGDKSERDSLNAKGMSFGCLCSHKIEGTPEVTPIDCDSPDKMREVNGFLAQVASYAVSLELEEVKEKLKEPGSAVRGCE